MSDGIEIRPATDADVRYFAGDEPAPTVRALVGVKDGQLLAIGGIRYVMLGTQRRLLVFFDLRPEGRKYKRAIVRGMRMLADMIRGGNAMAICSKTEPAAPHLLRRIGMVPVADSDEGVIYKCSR